MPQRIAAESFDRLALTIKAIGGGLWDYDVDKDELLCSRRWYELMGIDPATTPITSVSNFRSFIHPDDVDSATNVDLEQVDDLLKTDQPYHNEFRIVRPDGAIRLMRSVACIVKDPRDGHRRAVGCITDVTAEHGSPPESDVPPALARPEADPSLADSRLSLTQRERECLLWVSAGKTAWETSKILGRSQRTIEFHLRNAVAKLGASNKVHAATIAIRRGIL